MKENQTEREKKYIFRKQTDTTTLSKNLSQG